MDLFPANEKQALVIHMERKGGALAQTGIIWKGIDLEEDQWPAIRCDRLSGLVLDSSQKVRRNVCRVGQERVRKMQINIQNVLKRYTEVIAVFSKRNRRCG